MEGAETPSPLNPESPEMAAPTYSVDFTDITLAEDTAGWARHGISGNPGLGADFSQQGNFCIDKQVSNGSGGIYFNTGAGVTIPIGAHVWVWHFAATPGITQTIQNKGASVYIGTGTSAVCEYHIGGNDTYGAAGRVARCYPVDYRVRSQSSVAPYRTVTGTPGANPSLFGGGLTTTATARTNLGIDAIRYGTGAYITGGELVVAGDASDNPGTFAGYQSVNDSVSNRWGILTLVGGSYELQGKFAIGQNNTGVATLCRFTDADTNIVLADTPHSSTDFTQIIVDHASTVCILSNISITALGTHNSGRFVVTANDPIVTITGGTWTGMGAATLQGNTTLTGVALRQMGQIAQNGATLNACTVDSTTATAAILASDLSVISACSFTMGAASHAVEITTPGVYTFVGNKFFGFGASSTPSAAIYNNSGGAVTLNVTGGGDTPTIRNGTGATTTVNNNVSVTLNGLRDATEVRVMSSDNQVIFDGIEEVTAGTTDDRSFTFALAAGTVVNIAVFNTGYILPPNNRIENFVIPNNDTAIPIAQIEDRTYRNL